MQWRNSDGPLSSGEGIALGNQYTSGTTSSLVLDFDPLRVSHGGVFICETMITTAAPPYTLTEYAEFDVIVEGV